MSNIAEYVLAQLNEDRMGKQSFCDYSIKTATGEFFVHKCLLGVTSDFLRRMFDAEMTEKYQSFWNAEKFQPEIMDAILSFLYGSTSSITLDNVSFVVEAADYMQIPKLLKYCGEFVSTNLTKKNLFRNWQLAKQFRLENLTDICRKYAADNFLILSRCSEILSLEVAFFEEFLDARSNTTMEERAYETIISWINFDQENRSLHFEKLFNKIDLDQVSKSFINMEISSNELVLNNSVASKKLLQTMRKHLMKEPSGKKHVSPKSIQLTEKNSETTDFENTATPRSVFLPENRGGNETGSNAEKQDQRELQNFEETTKSISTSAIMPREKKNKSLQNAKDPPITNKQAKVVTDNDEVMPYQIYASSQEPVFSAMTSSNQSALVLQPVFASDQTFTARGKIMMQQIQLGKQFSPLTASQTVPKDQLASLTSIAASNLQESVAVPSPAAVQPQQLSEIVLIGGVKAPPYARKYNLKTKKWTRLPDVKGVCIEGQSARIKNFLYYLGGKSLKKNVSSLSQVWKFDTTKSNDTAWESCKEMNQKRYRFGCTVFRKKIYVVGGHADKTKFLSMTECYNPNTNSWKNEPNMNLARIGCGLVEHQGKLLAIGGQVQHDPQSYTITVEMLSGKRWIFSGTGLNEARSDFATVVFKDKIFVIGGKRYGTHLSSVEMFSKEKWNVTSSLKSPRSGHGACVIGNKIYVAGGKNEKGPVKSIEVFTPDENKWEVLVGDIKGDPDGAAIIAI